MKLSKYMRRTINRGDYVVYVGETIYPKHEHHKLKYNTLLRKNCIYKMSSSNHKNGINGYDVYYLYDDRNDVGGYELPIDSIILLSEYRDNKINKLI